MNCHECSTMRCSTKGQACRVLGSRSRYDELDERLMTVAASVEADFYGEMCRADEIIEFCRRMGYRRIGLAFCGGLANEAKTYAAVLEREFEVVSACCKIGGLTKAEMGHEQRPWLGPLSCNPAEQAAVMNEAQTDFNVVMGLCVGHDSVFFRHSAAPCTVVVVKDRRLGHNPVAAFTCPYLTRRLGGHMERRKS